VLAARAERLYLKIDSTVRGSVAGQIRGALTAWRRPYPGSGGHHLAFGRLRRAARELASRTGNARLLEELGQLLGLLTRGFDQSLHADGGPGSKSSLRRAQA
jgi:hypothetical protein